ncbi:MAG TPA: response regulator transcription factor [Bacteroidia bacterium]|nr:response regulator transcription factor [Bacteroidia bacterium]
MKVLIIEDEKELSDSIRDYLSKEQFVCEVAYDYKAANARINLNEYSCIILDITLPDGNGLELLKELKNRQKDDGVLIVSAKNSLEDRLSGLNGGADDYLTKPFHLSELLARVSAIVRRKYFGGKSSVNLGPLTLNLNERILKSTVGEVELTRKEYELLVFFVSNKNKVMTKEAIVEHLWGEGIDMEDSYDFIYTHIKNLRRKMMQAGCPDYIKAVYGMGYRFILNN